MPLQKNIYTFESLDSYPNLTNGVSTRFLGNMRATAPSSAEAQRSFATELGIPVEKIVRMVQTHSANVRWVTAADAGTRIEDTDALLTSEKDLFLGVTTADCVPLIVYDPQKEFVGVIHAGWRGLFGEIIRNTIASMGEKGSNPSDIKVAIGPCICVKCYEVGEELAKQFTEKFAKNGESLPYIKHEDGKVSLDIRHCAKSQLVKSGMNPDSIEDADICTKEQVDTFYSCRAEGKDTFGVFLSLVGMKS